MICEFCAGDVKEDPHHCERCGWKVTPGPALICGWCDKVLKPGRYPASHGICEACQLRAFNER